MKILTNEIVFRGHPDKVCDQIAAAILQEYLNKDPNARVGVEVFGMHDRIILGGEISSSASITINSTDIAKQILQQVGYNCNIPILYNINTQSPDIAQAVDTGGAGDNGIMYGYACNETKYMLPKAMLILQDLSQAYDKLQNECSDFLPDGKAEIVGLYDNGQLHSILQFIVCYQNKELRRNITDNMLKDYILELCKSYDVPVHNIIFNPTGKFCKGGFDADTGLTGRKIVVDSYQGFAKVGGGNMNGKDPTKVDITGAYQARALAKEYLIETGAKWAEVQIAYGIGMPYPLNIAIQSDKGTNGYTKVYAEYYTCDVQTMIKNLNMHKVDYITAAAFGHFRTDTL